MSKYREYGNLYRLNAWKTASKQFLFSNPVCYFCGAASEVTDHKVPHKGDELLFWDKSNWMPLCKKCHDSVKYRIELGQKPGKDFIPGNSADADGMPNSCLHPWNTKK